MHRRGFISALAGLPIAAVVQPRVSVPEVTTAPAADAHVVTPGSLLAKGLNPAKARVILNSFDVTKTYHVLAAQPGAAGFIEFHALGTDGALHGLGRPLPRVRLYGHVEVTVGT
jgi:hypothetical protein